MLQLRCRIPQNGNITLDIEETVCENVIVVSNSCPGIASRIDFDASVNEASGCTTVE
jgi:hypothetical protein